VYSENGDSHFPMPQVFASDKKDSVFMLKFPPQERISQNETIKPVKARISYTTKNNESRIIEIELEILVVNEGNEEIEVNEDVMVNFYRCKAAEILKNISQLAETNKFEEAKELARITAEELKECLVKDHPVLQALIKDLQDAINRVSSRMTWEQGGRAQIQSVQSNHYAQKASNNTMAYQNCQQVAYSSAANSYFGKQP